MAEAGAELAHSYVATSRSVLDAGKLLRSVLDDEPDTRHYAIRQLEGAVDQLETGATSYRSFMFAELDESPPLETASEQLAEDTLASILLDVESANMVMAAGNVTDEELLDQNETAQRALFDDMLMRLEETTAVVAQSGFGAEMPVVGYRRFAFADAAPTSSTSQVEEISDPSERFRFRADETLTLVVGKTQTSAKDIVKELLDLPADMALGGLELLGKPFERLPKVGRLFRKGVVLLERAIDALVKLVNSTILAQVKGQAIALWKRLSASQPGIDFLEDLYGVGDTRNRMDNLLSQSNLRADLLRTASEDLDRLNARFENTLGITQHLRSALRLSVKLTKVIVAVTALTAAQLALIAASAYGILLATVILIGMDFADAGRLLRWVRGVGQIVDGLRTA